MNHNQDQSNSESYKYGLVLFVGITGVSLLLGITVMIAVILIIV